MTGHQVKQMVALSLVGALVVAGWLLLRPSERLSPEDGSAKQGESATSQVFFPTYKSKVYFNALLERSTLVLHDGCLFAGGRRDEILLVWPEGFRFAGGRVLSGSGREIARVGGPFRSGGGFIEPKDAAKLIGKSVPEVCLAPGETVWLVAKG